MLKIQKVLYTLRGVAAAVFFQGMSAVLLVAMVHPDTERPIAVIAGVFVLIIQVLNYGWVSLRGWGMPADCSRLYQGVVLKVLYQEEQKEGWILLMLRIVDTGGTVTCKVPQNTFSTLQFPERFILTREGDKYRVEEVKMTGPAASLPSADDYADSTT